MRTLTATFILAGLAAVACSASRTPQPTPGSGVVVPGLTIYNGVLALPGHDTAVRSIVLEKRDSALVIREITSRSTTATTDSFNAEGLYVHSAHALDAENPAAPGERAIFVLREGPSQSDPARFTIHGGPDLQPRRIEPSENAPSPSAHHAVGCYAVELGEWSGADPSLEDHGIVIPDTLRLHWQYGWQLGRERMLVVTDGANRVPGPRLTYYSWRTLENDSLQVALGTGWYAVEFRMASAGTDWNGRARFTGHTVPGPRSEAPAKFTRLQCP